MQSPATKPAVSGKTDAREADARHEEQTTRARPRGGAASYGFNGTRRVPTPVNEPVRSYAPGSPERAALKARLKTMAGERADILVGGGASL